MATSPPNQTWSRLWLVSPVFGSHSLGLLLPLWKYFPSSSQALKSHLRLPAPCGECLACYYGLWDLLYLAAPKHRILPYLLRSPLAGLECMPSLFCLGSDSTQRVVPFADTSVALPSALGLQYCVQGCSSTDSVFILLKIRLPAWNAPVAWILSSSSDLPCHTAHSSSPILGRMSLSSFFKIPTSCTGPPCFSPECELCCALLHLAVGQVINSKKRRRKWKRKKRKSRTLLKHLFPLLELNIQ